MLSPFRDSAFGSNREPYTEASAGSCRTGVIRRFLSFPQCCNLSIFVHNPDITPNFVVPKRKKIVHPRIDYEYLRA